MNRQKILAHKQYRSFFRVRPAYYPVLAATFLLLPATGYSEINDLQPQKYHTPQERREAGQRHELTDWLAVMALVELEWSHSQDHFFPEGAANGWDNANSQTLQLALEAEINNLLSAQLVTEYEASSGQGIIDEATLDLDWNSWSAELGKQNLSFGEYFSDFVTDPLLEFAETRANALDIEYQLNDFSEISSYLYQSNTQRETREHSSIEWGMGFETRNSSDSFKVGFGYISSLAAAIADLLEDSGNIVIYPTAAWSGYLAVMSSSFELTLEALQTLRRSDNRKSRSIKPSAINLEIAWIPKPELQIGLRLEGSKDLPMQPSKRYGISANWRISPQLSLKADYLYGVFPGQSGDEAYTKYRQEAAFQVSFGF